MKSNNQKAKQPKYQTTMNPNSISSTFSVQQVSKHHYLIRGDERVKDYMNFCDVKWSNTYQGWIVHEDDEVDLIQMHMEVLDLAKEQKTKIDKKKSTTTKPKTTQKKKPAKKKLIVSSDEESEDEKPKKKTTKKDVLYERFKRGEEISDDDDDEYVPSSEPSSETISDESDDEEDEEEEEEDSETEEDSDEEEEYETDPKRKKEFQFYKKGILAFGKMSERQQEKLEAIWNKTLRGWILRMSSLEKLKKMGWLEVGNEVPKEPKESKEVKEPIKPVEVVQKPKVTKKPKEIEEKTFEEYMYALLVKGELTPEQMTEIQGIYHPGLKGVLVGMNNREKLGKMGFRDTKPKETKETKEKEVVKIQFTTGEQLKVE